MNTVFPQCKVRPSCDVTAARIGKPRHSEISWYLVLVSDGSLENGMNIVSDSDIDSNNNINPSTLVSEVLYSSPRHC